MISGISKLIFSLFVGIAAVSTAQAVDFPRFDEAIPRGGNTEKYAPVFDFDGDGCLPSAGFSLEGLKNPGLAPDSATEGCRSDNFLNTSNTLHRYACITSGGSSYCGHFYSLYFVKDYCKIFGVKCGHRHDWEYAAVWTKDGAMTHGSVSAHGDLETRTVSDLPFEGDHFKVVYHATTTHSFRFAKDNEAAENPYGSFVTPVLISWYELTGNDLSNKEMRDLINGFCYWCDEEGGGTIPMNDDKFLNNLNEFRPYEFCLVGELGCIPKPGTIFGIRYIYPEFTQESINASNPNKPVLAFVAGDGVLRGEDTEYVIDFGKIPRTDMLLSAELAVGNDVSAPADNLDGDFDTTGAAPYLVTGFERFTALAPGDYLDGLLVEIATAGLGLGFVSGEIEFQPEGLVDTGTREPLDPITLMLSVQIVNQEPDCSQGVASNNLLWPPNHKFVSVNVLGVTDPDGDPVTITIDNIFQDEPVDSFGDGRFSPDGAGVATATAELRAERSGTKKIPGNGRVYHISYTADDGQGGSCSGHVAVAVPHDRNAAPVDDGATFDSTVP